MTTRATTGAERRARLARARLMLLFTPELCPRGADPLAVLARVLPYVDVVQVRVKEPGLGLAPARASAGWCARVLALVTERRSDALVLVDDRVDVAVVLARVVSRPRADVVTCDAGSKSLAAEAGAGNNFRHAVMV